MGRRLSECIGRLGLIIIFGPTYCRQNPHVIINVTMGLALNSGKTKKQTAMLLDYTSENATIIRDLLANFKIELVEWKTEGVGWVADWQRVKPDFFFVDLQLPKRDGLFVVEKLRQMDPQVVICFMHSYVGMHANHIELRAMALGAAMVIQKPIVEKRFEVGIRRLVGIRNKVKGLKRMKFSG